MLTIYHIEGRRSQAVIWLCEEIGLAYELVFTRGNIAASLDTIRQVNPLLPLAPTIRYKGKVMVETGAILEYLLSQLGGGALVPPQSSLDYADYLMWLHFAEGTAATRILGDMTRMRTSGEPRLTPNIFPGSDMELVGTRHVLRFIEAHLAQSPYFGGPEFSAADIMMHMVARFAGMLPIDPSEYAGLAAWRARVEQRPAFQRAMAAGLPDGKVPGEAQTTARLMGRQTA